MPARVVLKPRTVIEVQEKLHAAETLLEDLSEDAALRTRFVASPAAVLAERQLVRDGSQGGISAANKLFVSIITNQPLVDWIRENEPDVRQPPEVESVFRNWASGRGQLSLPAAYKKRVIETLLNNEHFLREVLRRLAADPVVGRALPTGVGEPELQSWLSESIDKVRTGNPLTGGNAILGALIVPFLLIVVVILAVAVFIDKHDGRLASLHDESNYVRVRNLIDLSRQLSQLRPQP